MVSAWIFKGRVTERSEMEQKLKTAGTTRKLFACGWAVACFITAFFIPKYDFGFDGVKVWFYLCAIMLVFTIGAIVLVERMPRDRTGD